jgi:DNA polymerase
MPVMVLDNHKIKTTSKWYRHFGVCCLFIDRNRISITTDNPETFETVDDLRSFITKTDLCNLKRMVKNTVFSDGDPKSKIMIIGEAPGEQEDEKGLPFVGQSGQLLDMMLKSVGILRREIYITNIVFWRPPGNRTPTVKEISACLPYVKKHIRLVSPRVLLLLGMVAIQSILNTKESISKIRGRIHMYENIKVIPTFHPAYLLRSPNQKVLAFRDMLLLRDVNTKGAL